MTDNIIYDDHNSRGWTSSVRMCRAGLRRIDRWLQTVSRASVSFHVTWRFRLTGLEFLTGLRDATLVAPPFSETTAIRPVRLEQGRVAFEGIPSERFYNPMGVVHGGWIATLLDTAMACAIHSMLQAGQAYTTLELKTNFVRPVVGSTGALRCEGAVLSFGGARRQRRR